MSNSNGTYHITQSISVDQAAATVTLSNLSHTYDGTAKSATATTNPAGKTVSITYGGSAAAPTNVGTYAIVATITDSNYTGTASDNLVIGKATPVITWATPAAITYGTALSATQLNATSGGAAGSMVYTPALGSTPSAGTQTLSVTFTPTDSTNYSSVTKTLTLTVNQAALKGDLDGNQTIDLADMILSMQIVTDQSLPGATTINAAADVNGVGRIGMAEAIYIMQALAGMR